MRKFFGLPVVLFYAWTLCPLPLSAQEGTPGIVTNDVTSEPSTAEPSSAEESADIVMDQSIVPAQRMGFAILGQTRAEYVMGLRDYLSSASITAKNHSHGIEEIIARYQSRTTGLKSQFEVLLQRGKIVQISTNDREFSLEGGYNSGTDISRFNSRFPGMKSTNYYFSAESGVGVTKILDQVEQGFSVADRDLGATINYLLGGFRSPYFLTVHAANRPYIAIWDGSRASTKQTPAKPQVVLKPIKLTGGKLRSAQRALRAIKQLRTVITVGTTYADYSQRVVNAAVEVNESLAVVPQSDFRKEVVEAMKAFTNARGSWSSSLDNNFMGLSERMRDIFWDTASKHVANAEKLLK